MSRPRTAMTILEAIEAFKHDPQRKHNAGRNRVITYGRRRQDT